MKQYKRILRLLGATTLLVGIIAQAIPPGKVFANQITTRSLTLQAGTTDSDGDGIPDGGSMPGGIVNHLFNFNLPSSTAVGSITFKYCTTAAPVAGGIDCNLPVGTDTTTAALGNETGVTGFSVSTGSPNGTVILSRGSATAITPGAVSYRLDNIKNPTTTNQTFFVRISTYGSLDGSGTAIDTGTVAASTATPIKLTGTMPESLVFCTGRTINMTNSVPDCSTASDGAVAFDRLFSPQDTALATSQMAASTNAGTGYVVTVNGPTLTSGSNTIASMNTQDTSKFSISQFGMNVVANTNTNPAPAGPVVGSAIAPASNGTNYRGAAATGYDSDGEYKFTSGETVAQSTVGTDAQIYTASYIVNVPGSQPAGTYTTTLTYICTPTF